MVRSAAVVAGLLVAGTVACNSSEPEAEPTTTATSPGTEVTSSTVPPRTTSPLLTDPERVLALHEPRQLEGEERDVIYAYVRAEQQDHIASLAPPDPNYPGLLETFTGQELRSRQQRYGEYAAKGQAYTEAKTFKVTVGQLKPESPGVYLIESCMVTDSHLYDVASGQPLEGEEVYGLHVVSAMNLVDGAWKLERSAGITVSSGVLGCSEFPLSLPLSLER